MATPDQHIDLYGKLRARLLAQHFAYSRHHRANLLSLWNWVVEPPAPGATPAELAELKRWNVIVHGRENPLAFSTHLFAFLAAEHALGHARARPIIDLALDAIGDLYKFKGTFGGYLTRWDALTTAQREGMTPPDVEDFLVGEDGQYLYSIPATDPRHVPFRDPGTLRRLKSQSQADEYEKLQKKYTAQYRSSEVSMDELAGLVGAYAIAFRLVDRADTRARINKQVRKLGDYLAEHGFLLVRPTGGFTARGATGVLPAYELPFVSAFGDITRRDFSSRSDFMRALGKAGYTRVLAGPIRAWEIGALVLLLTGVAPAALTGLIGFVQGTAGLLGIPLAGPLVVGGTVLMEVLAAIGVIVGPINLLRAIAVFLHQDCFDVENANAAGEVAIAVLLKGAAPRDRLRLLFRAISLGAGSFAVSHLPALALSAVDGTDPTVGSLYWNLVAEWRRAPPAAETPAGTVSQGPFTSAVALLHAGSARQTERDTEETKLVTLLNEHHDKLRDNYGSDLPLEGMEGNIEFTELTERTNVIDMRREGHLSVVQYLGALALAWLYERRRRDAGRPVTTSEFPVAPTLGQFDAFPTPSIKGFVVNRLPHVQRSVRPVGVVTDAVEIDLFSARVRTRRAPPLVPKLPARPTNLVVKQTITVRESDKDVYTGIELRYGDEYEITAAGQIRGFALAGLSGPDGWAPDQLVDDARWPLHTGLDPSARKFALLGCLGGYFVVGAHLPRTRFFFPWPLTLYLRINDDVPGDGSGEFQVTIQLWGEPRAVWSPGTTISCVTRDAKHRISGVGGIRPDGSRWFVPLDQAIRFADGGHRFMVGNAKVEVRRSRRGRLYLRTANDGQRANNLSSLPFCP